MNSAPATTQIPVVFSDAEAERRPDVERAIKAARAAQSRWSRAPVALRLKPIRELRRLIAENALQLAEASASARNRPALESLTAEVMPLAEACRFLERNAGRILAPRRVGRRGRPIWLSGVSCEIHREPHGVVLVIGPGNYPLLIPGVQVIQALAAGNAVLLKPGAGGTPAAEALLDLIGRAGFAPQLVTVLDESADAARAAIAAHPDKVLFTGSAATGEKILRQLASHLVPATMELSGSDAVIVRSDADLDLTVKALMFGFTLNGGATCIAPKRVFVHQSVASDLEGRLSRSFNFPADGTGAPNSPASERLCPLIKDALNRGARFLAGNEHANGPVILGGVDPSSRLLREDIFAPILSIVAVADDAEAVFRANDCPLALSASIFSRDELASHWLAAHVRAGFVSINDLIIPTADARLPFGGRGRSGFGVTRGEEGLLELTTPKVVTMSRGKFRPALDPAHPGDEALFNAYFRLVHCRSLKTRFAALVSLIRSLSRRYKSTSQENA